MSWKTHQDQNGKLSYYMPKAKLPSSDKVLIVDLDWTLIKPESGTTFPMSESDWVFRFKLKELREKHKNGYLIAVVTNQKSLLAKRGISEEEFQNRWRKILTFLKFPVYLLYSMYDDFYRKPRTGMFDFLESLNGKPFNLTQSLYVGDGAGRKKDFSDTDYKFALNIGIPFETPERFFEMSGYDKDQTKNLPKPVHPIKVLGNYEALENNNQQFWQTFYEILPNFNGLIVMIGSPASGKSTFIKKHIIGEFPEFIHTGLDQMKSKSKLEKYVIEQIKQNKTVVIDNTNPEGGKRFTWIQIGRTFGKPVVGIHIDTSKELSLHLNTFRSCKKIIAGSEKTVPEVALHKYYKGFEKPRSDEGFYSLMTYTFNPEFENEDDKNKIMMFLR